MMRMNSRIAIAFVALLCCSIYAVAQESGAEKMVRPRVVTPPVEQSATQNPATPAVPSLAPAAAEAPQKLAPGPIQHLTPAVIQTRSEEHTSELQSQSNLVCRLLLEKKKNQCLTLLAGGSMITS